MTRVLLTGASGFLGAHVLEHLMARTGWHVTVVKRGPSRRLEELLRDDHPEWNHRIRQVTADLEHPGASANGFRAALGEMDYVIALASRANIDESLRDPAPFLTANMAIMANTLEIGRAVLSRRPSAKFLLVSSDQVYGPATDGDHREWDTINPPTPYAASKAAQEAAAMAYWRSYNLPVVIANVMNVYGERANSYQFIPKVISAVRNDEEVTIHGTDDSVGARRYLHARNAADAMLFLLQRRPVAPYPDGSSVPRWNIAGPIPVSNLEVAQRIAEAAGRKLRYRLTGFDIARPGHDPYYGLDAHPLATMGWYPPVSFRESLARTVRWTLAHPEWLEG